MVHILPKFSKSFSRIESLYFDVYYTEIYSYGYNYSELVQILAWRRIGRKPSEPVMAKFVNFHMNLSTLVKYILPLLLASMSSPVFT